nr:hypothetical protein [Tanacetum cinerariifolium]
MIEGRTVLLNPPVTAAPGDSGDIIDKMFDEGNNANQERSVGKDDDVLEEVVALEASEKLRDDHQSLPPPTGGKSLSALRGMVPEGSAIPIDATEPLITASVTLIFDIAPVDSMSGLNLWTCPSHVRYVVSSDSSHCLGSYSKTTSLVRSGADVSVVTVSVTTTVDANVATGPKTKDAPKDFENCRFCSRDTETVHRVYVPRWKVTNDSVLDDPYVCHDMTDRLAPALFTQLRAMDFDQLYSEFNVGAARQATLLSEKDAKVAHLRSLVSLKEAEAAEVIPLRSQLSVVEAADAAKGTELRDLKEKKFALEGGKNVLFERVETIEFVAASKEVELASLSSQVVNLTVDLSGFQFSCEELNFKVASLESERDFLATQKNSLESAFELFKEQVKKMQDEQ